MSMNDRSETASVCGHIARDRSRIGFAFRDPPTGTVESGWRFVCNTGLEEREDDGEVWTLAQVLEHEPTVQELLNSPVGTALVRDARYPESWLSVQQGLP